MRIQTTELTRSRTTNAKDPDALEDTRRIGRLFTYRDGMRHVEPGATIFLHGQSADHVYQIVSGTARCCTITQDGRRQIFSFAQAGDYLGLAEIVTWHYTAEAVSHVALCAVPRERLENAILADANLQRSVRRQIARELAARERQLANMAQMTAEERLKRFLSDFARRQTTDDFVTLPMRRMDIGDHLGMTLETVSRTFGALRRKGIIQMHGSDRFRIREPETALAA